MRDYECIIKDLGLDKDLDITRICNLWDISRTTFYNVVNNKKEPSVRIAIHLTREINYVLYKKGFFTYLEVDDLFVSSNVRKDVIENNVTELKKCIPHVVEYLEFTKKESWEGLFYFGGFYVHDDFIKNIGAEVD